MLQITAYNTYNLDILCISLNLRNQTADTSDDHLYLYSCLRCFHQFIDDHLICQGIDLDSNISFISLFHLVDFFLYHIQNSVLQTFRCNQKKIGFLNNFPFQKSCKHFCCFFSDFLVCCDQRQVCVKCRCFFIIITCTDLCDIGHTLICFSGDQAQLGMYFISIQSIDHSAACLFQFSGIFNITFLIKSGSQLYKYNNFFSIFCCIHQSIYNLALVCKTVQCHLNRYNRVILRSLIQKINERFDIFKRIG